jgi:hypothetical protein
VPGPQDSRAGRTLRNSDEIKAFLTTGLRAPWEQDTRVRVAQILAVGGPEVKHAAQIALSGTREELQEFSKPASTRRVSETTKSRPWPVSSLSPSPTAETASRSPCP